MNRRGSGSQEGQVMNSGNEGTEIIVQASPLRSLRFFNTPSPSDTGSPGNNNETTFLERFSSSPVVGSSNENREVSNNNNNGAPRDSSSLLEVNLNSSPPGFSASPNRLNNPMGSDIDVTYLGINNNNNRQNEVSLDLSLHPSGGEGGSSFGGGATEQAAVGNGGLTTVRNTTTTAATAAAAAARRMKRTAPDYPRRELTVGESSSRGGGGSVPEAMAAPKRRATANESAVVHISSSSSSTCTCTPAPTCPIHGGSNNNNNNNNNNSPSSSRERNRQTTTSNNSNNNNVVVLGGSSSSASTGGPVSELQRAFRSGTSFQGLQPNNHHHMVTTTTTIPSNDFNFNGLINNPELDLMIIDSTIPLLDNHHHHHHHLHHGDQFPPPVTSFYHHGHQCYFATADTPYPFGPVSTITHLDHLPPHRRFAASSSSSPPPPSPLPWTSVVRPRAIPSLSVTHRRGGGGGSSSEANNIIIRSNNPSPSYGRRGGIINYATQNLGNSPSSSTMFSTSSLSNQLLGSLVENAGSPSSGSSAAQNTVGAVPAFQHLSSVARAWIQRLNAHDETLMRASPSATAEDPSSTRQRALRASVADTHNLPTFFADSRRLREEIRSAVEHLRSGGSVRLEELLILDYSIVLNLLDTVDEVDDESVEIIEGRRGSNPDIGLTENEILSFIGREIFQTVGEQPQNNDACSICQEDYVDGEELGRLDCSHRYHLSCIKQWLVIKNRCPACKQMGLTIIDVDEDDED